MESRTVEILVVEDSPPQALVLRRVLEENGYRVRVASDGAQAIEALKERPAELVISDIVMPEMDGYQLCRRIKSDEALRETPVLLVTMLAEPEDVIRGLEAGADGFLTKPYDREQLLSRIEYLLVNLEIRNQGAEGAGVEIFFAGKKLFVSSGRTQILDMLLATYQEALQQKRRLEQANRELQAAMRRIKRLEGIIPICASCKKIRDDGGSWHQLELYIRDHSEADFSHGICPECMEELYPDCPISGKKTSTNS